MATLRTSAVGGASSGTGNRTCTITPAVGDLLVVYCCVAANTNDSPTCSDNNGSGTYDLVEVANFAIAAVNYRMSVFVRTALMTNTTSTIITPATGSNSSGSVVALAITNITRAGITAVRSSGVQNNQAAGTAAPTLNQTSLTGNLTIVALGSADTTTTAPTNWTERQNGTQTADVVCLEVATRNSGFAGTTITYGAATSTVFCSHALELDCVLHLVPADSLNFWSDGTPRNIFDYGLQVSDSLNNWAEPPPNINLIGGETPLTQSVSDDINNWADGLVGTRQPRWLDTHAESLGGGGAPTPLTQTAEDSLDNWQDALLGDTLDRWRDSSATALGSEGVTPLTQSASDSLNFWADGLLGDNLNRWQDAVVTDNQAAGATPLTKAVSDSINFLADDTTPLHQLDFDINAFEDLNNWDDDVATDLAVGGPTPLTKTVSDSLNFWADQPRLGYGLRPSESINNWLDVAVANRLPVLLSISQFDSLNFWQDTHNKTLFGALISLQQTDTINNWADQPRLGYGLRPTDNLANWLDVAAANRLPVLLSISRSDSLNFWADLVRTIPSSDFFYVALWRDVALLTLATSDVQLADITTTESQSVSLFHTDTAAVLLKTADTATTSITTKSDETVTILYKDERSI